MLNWGFKVFLENSLVGVRIKDDNFLDSDMPTFIVRDLNVVVIVSTLVIYIHFDGFLQ